jgi:hypothetical protein
MYGRKVYFASLFMGYARRVYPHLWRPKSLLRVPIFFIYEVDFAVVDFAASGIHVERDMTYAGVCSRMLTYTDVC